MAPEWASARSAPTLAGADLDHDHRLARLGRRRSAISNSAGRRSASSISPIARRARVARRRTRASRRRRRRSRCRSRPCRGCRRAAPMPPTRLAERARLHQQADAAGTHARQHRADPGRRAARRHHAHAVRADHPRVVRAAQLGQPDARRGADRARSPGPGRAPRSAACRARSASSMPATTLPAPSPTQASSGTWSRSAIDGTTAAPPSSRLAGMRAADAAAAGLQVADELAGDAVALGRAEHDGGRGLEERPQVGAEEGRHVPVCGDGRWRPSSITSASRTSSAARGPDEHAERQAGREAVDDGRQPVAAPSTSAVVAEPSATASAMAVLHLLDPVGVRLLDGGAQRVVEHRVRPHLAPQDAVLAHQRVAVGDVDAEQALEALGGGVEPGDLLVHVDVDAGVGEHEGRPQQLGAGGEVVVDERGRNVRLAGHVRHAQPRGTGRARSRGRRHRAARRCDRSLGARSVGSLTDADSQRGASLREVAFATVRPCLTPPSTTQPASFSPLTSHHSPHPATAATPPWRMRSWHSTCR